MEILNYMSRDIADISGDATVTDAISIMRERKIGSLLVKNKSVPIGIFTERDLLNKVDLTRISEFKTVRVKNIMTKGMKIADAKDSYVKVIGLMKKYNIRHMPVVQGGNVIGIVSFRDLSIRYHKYLEHLLKEREFKLKESVRQIKEAEERFKAIFDSSAVSIILTDRKENIVLCNPFTFQLLGMRSDELLGKPVFSLYPKEEWEKIRKLKIHRLGIDHYLDTKVIDKSGRLVDVDILISALKNGEGKITGSIGIMRDITERRMAERLRAELMKDLEFTNKELDDFTYIVSHDLKEPLRNIDAFSKFVISDYRDKLDDDGVNYLERIRANAVRMFTLIEDLLKLSLIDRKKNVFEYVEISGIIREVEARLEYAIEKKKVKITVKGSMPKVFCDRVRLTEVFFNLVSNAIKFSKKNELPFIEIGCRNVKAFYKFYIKDNGIGIDEKFQKKIFDIFHRLVGRQEYEGTGAGLAIVKKIVKMHKGKVWVKSSVGKGSVFYFTIPRDKKAVLGRRKLGRILVEKGLISEEDLKSALEKQRDFYERQ